MKDVEIGNVLSSAEFWKALKNGWKRQTALFDLKPRFLPKIPSPHALSRQKPTFASKFFDA